MADLLDVRFTVMLVEGVAGRTLEEAVADLDNIVEYFEEQKNEDERVFEVEHETYETELELSGETRKAAVAKIRMKSWMRWDIGRLAKACSAFVETDELAWREVYGPDEMVWFDEELDPDKDTERTPDIKKIVEDGWPKHFLIETARGGGVLSGEKPEQMTS